MSFGDRLLFDSQKQLLPIHNQIRIVYWGLLTNEVRQTLEDEHAMVRKEGVTWKPYSIRHRTSTFRQLLRR
jgi:hypothetical protein